MLRVRALLSRYLSLTLGGLASRWPRVAFHCSDALAALWALTSRRPTRAELHTLFPHLTRADSGPVLRRIWISHARTLLLGGWIRRDGIAPIRMLVRPNDAIAQLRPPMIVGTFHIGPTLGLGTLSERLNGETLVLRGTQFPLDRATHKNVDLIEGTEQQRAATFHRAIERLRGDGFVIMALDPKEAHRIAVPFLHGTLHLARGAFAMARIARVPIVPLVARWDGDAIDLLVGDALPMSDDEQTLAASAAQWLEKYLVESPGELSYRILELM
jgi:lauroyl/myristoyl acyltransferase